MRAVSSFNKGFSGARLASSLAAPRRLRNRSGWPSINEEPVMFPDEHLGNDYSLNWAIASYNMTASGEAFHNLHLRGLTMLTTDKLDKNKAVVREVDAKSVGDTYIVGEDVADPVFGKLVRRARKALTDSDKLFVHDGSLGLTRASGPTVRSFCSDAESALLLHNLLRTFRLPLSEDSEGEDVLAWREALPEELRNDPEEVARQVRLGQLDSPPVHDPHALTQFLVPGLGGTGPGLEGGSFSVVDATRRIVMHAGSNVNVASVRDGLVQLATRSASWSPDSQVLDADAFLTEHGSVVVFGGQGSWSGGSLPWSAHNTVWTADNTLVPVWLSGTVQGTEDTHFGDYVEVLGKTQTVLGRRRSPTELFEAPTPKAILFVESGKKSAVKINPEQARKLGLPDALVERVAKHKISLVSVPPCPTKSTADAWINKALGK